MILLLTPRDRLPSGRPSALGAGCDDVATTPGTEVRPACSGERCEDGIPVPHALADMITIARPAAGIARLILHRPRHRNHSTAHQGINETRPYLPVHQRHIKPLV
ncbi:hypothetical protein ACWEJ6_51380 [Nonomuraea sp. NPDC004702]